MISAIAGQSNPRVESFIVDFQTCCAVATSAQSQLFNAKRIMDRMIGLPERTEAAEYYFTYIERITSADIVGVLETQTDETTAFLRGISEEKSLYRYAPGKWSIRQAWNHVNDAERVFVCLALLSARGFDSPMPSLQQELPVA